MTIPVLATAAAATTATAASAAPRHLARAFAISLLLFHGGANSLSTSRPADAARKTILVTGANKGIGWAICRRLVDQHPDVRVLLGSRDAARGEQAASDLIASDPYRFGGGRVECIVLDVSSDESVRAAAEKVSSGEIGGGEGRLYGIVNNAGIIGRSYEDTLNVNYFGPRRVNDAFGPMLMRPGGRIVNIASASGPMFVASCGSGDLRRKLSSPLSIEGGISELDDMARSYLGQVDYNGDSYGLSKALLNAYTALHAREEEEEESYSGGSGGGLIINSCSPGFIKTDLTVNAGMGASNPPEMGAFAPVELLLNGKFMNLPTGRYYGSDAVRSPLDRYRGPGEAPYEGP